MISMLNFTNSFKEAEKCLLCIYDKFVFFVFQRVNMANFTGLSPGIVYSIIVVSGENVDVSVDPSGIQETLLFNINQITRKN